MLKIVKNLIIRILAYSFCVFLFILCYYMVFENNYEANSLYTGRSVFYGVIGLLFAPVYPIVDIIIMLKEFFKKK